MDFVVRGGGGGCVDVLGLRVDRKARAMNKAEAIESLNGLRWALDALPDTASIVHIDGGGVASKPELHVDRASVYDNGAEVRTRRITLNSVEHYRMVGNVKVFCVELVPVPEGV